MKNALGNWSDSPCYYVDVRDAGRTAIIAGPFTALHYALSALRVVRGLAIKADPWSHFYSWGTCKLETGHKSGSFNSKLREIDPSIDRGVWSHTQQDIDEAIRQESEINTGRVVSLTSPAYPWKHA